MTFGLVLAGDLAAPGRADGDADAIFFGDAFSTFRDTLARQLS